ncbi:MAG: efflux RND transporter periplasmic adaptor subunit [Shewanella sp.]|nr:efflux RND transporter periplasmic adaptor subunit [Shewanella sp.]MCF1430686.1 efflux RND transporter periplasmic adaptor subunit [Shewanella sp.]MCF1438752.1 efflux RND transporter periplasmic adaptor subunit [Shewanella sp.]MCF1456867.1 efflux RND transporter periplasmic adaptor subunit [Shewanella sp.]
MNKASSPLLPLSLFAMFFLVFLGLFSPSLYAKPGLGGKPGAAREVAVVTGLVGQETLAQQVTVIGKLTAKKSVDLAPQIAGKVSHILVSDNQKVVRDQILLELDNARAKAARDEARAYQQDEQRKLAEYMQLKDSDAITQSEIDAQRAKVAMANARLEAAAAELEYHSLKAPFDGHVGLIDFSEGKMVTTGTELLTLDNLSQLHLDLAVPEQYLARLSRGMSVQARSQAWHDTLFNGQVVAIDPRVNPQNLNLTVRVAFDNPELKLMPGMMMSADISLPAVTKAVIPVQALEYSGTKRYVYLLGDDSKVKRTEVKLGARIGDKVLINGGVKVNDVIVVQGLVNMRDGIKVKVLPQQTANKLEPAGERG